MTGYDSDLMEQRQGEVCEICKTRMATEWNHCCKNRLKGYPILNRIYNLQHVCHPCHTSVGHTTRNREEFWFKQFLEYGDEFLEWWDEVVKTFNANLGYVGLREDAERMKSEEERAT